VISNVVIGTYSSGRLRRAATVDEIGGADSRFKRARPQRPFAALTLPRPAAMIER
jgi:hypothetical protein